MPDEISMNQRWNHLKVAVIKSAEEVCGKIKQGRRERRETWWWNHEVQAKIKAKKDAYKQWQKTGDVEKKQQYKKAKKEAKKAVAQGRYEAGNELYENLGTSKRRISDLQSSQAEGKKLQRWRRNDLHQKQTRGDDNK